MLGPSRFGGSVPDPRQALRFTEEQIISILKEGEAGVPTAALCRKHGVSTASYYKWRSRYGGIEVSEAKKLRDLADENGRLKALVAELTLDNQMHSSSLRISGGMWRIA